MSITTEPRVPPLVVGDKLTREEFLRRWEAEPRIKHAELLKGIVYVPSPVSIEHGVAEGCVGGWLAVYQAATRGTIMGRNMTSFIMEDMPQPDLYLRVLEDHGGRSWAKGNYLCGIPELLVEICWSSEAYDLHVKLELYQAAQIPEYLAILLYEQEIRWHVLTDGKYQPMPPDTEGIYRSRIFPGLWLDGKALLAGNMQRVLGKLQEWLQSPEHQGFVEQLAKVRKS